MSASIRVEYFGSLNTVFAEPFVVPVASAISVDELLTKILHQHPEFSPHLPRTAVAVGDELRQRQSLVQPGETAVLIPPVAGG